MPYDEKVLEFGKIFEICLHLAHSRGIIIRVSKTLVYEEETNHERAPLPTGGYFGAS